MKKINIFIIIMIFKYMLMPFGIIPIAIGKMSNCYISYKRITEFLN